MPLQQLLEALAGAATITIEPPADAGRSVSVSVPGRPLDAGLRQLARTLHEAGQEDYFSVTVQPGGLVTVNVEDTSRIFLATLLDTDGTTELDSAILEGVTRWSWRDSFLEIGNETDEAQTYFVKFEATNGTDTGYYAPFYEDYGVDADGDDFYSQDWAGDRDCDDNDATVNPEASYRRWHRAVSPAAMPPIQNAKSPPAYAQGDRLIY